jgi:hypothetical protein
VGLLCLSCAMTVPVRAQTPAQTPAAAAAPAPRPAPPPLELDSLSWLGGCWRGQATDYEFREHWLPLRGGLMVGAGHVTFKGKTQDYGYLRLETRPDGVYYVAISSANKETAFKLTAINADDVATVFTFTNSGDTFPQRIVYRRGVEGWLYASVEGKDKGEEKDRKVVYPMRRVDCQSGEFIRN